MACSRHWPIPCDASCSMSWWAGEEAGASALAVVVPVSRQAVLKHLNVLDDAGLVTARRSGREVLYRARPERLQATAARMSELAARWDERLDQIKRIAES